MKNYIITGILIVLVGMVAFWYLGNKNNSNSSTLADTVTSANSADAQYIYTTLQQMAQVTLEDAIFANSIFQNLKDNTQPLPDQSLGRNNPFAPVGTDSSASGQTVSATSSSH